MMKRQGTQLCLPGRSTCLVAALLAAAALAAAVTVSCMRWHH